MSWIKAKNGNVIEVTDESLVERLERQGHEVIGNPTRSGAPDLSWKLDELKAYAADHAVDLGDATKKADVLAAIELAAEDDDSTE